MITNINEFKEQIIRISCASLASIKHNDLYLVCLNKRQLKVGKKVYTPFGGALEYTDNALDFLNSINANFEKNKDLRFTTSLNNLPNFKIWFDKKIDREVGIDRELVEELVEEEKILLSLNTNDYVSKYIRTDISESYYNDINNYRFFEIYEIKFNDLILEMIDKEIKTENSNIRYISQSEINNLITDDGIEIGDNCKNILI